LVPAVGSVAASQRTVSDVSMCGGKERSEVWQVQRPLKLAQQVTLPGTSLVDSRQTQFGSLRRRQVLGGWDDGRTRSQAALAVQS
jgi:hypothetical protein